MHETLLDPLRVGPSLKSHVTIAGICFIPAPTVNVFQKAFARSIVLKMRYRRKGHENIYVVRSIMLSRKI